MSAGNAPGRTSLRVFFVVALSVIVLVAGGMDFRRIWTPIGLFGYTGNGDQTVTFVSADSPAAKAGIAVGDRIDMTSTPVQYRHLAAQAGTAAAGESATVAFVHQGTLRMVTLTSIPQVTERYYPAYRVAVLAVGFLFVALGAALVLLRPSVMTWGFFAYCLAYAPFTFYVATMMFSFPYSWIAWPVQYALEAAGTVGLLVFALCFLNEPLTGWRQRALGMMPWLLAALVIYELLTIYYWGWVGAWPGELISRGWLATHAVVDLLAMYLFLDTYVRARGTDRQRMRWVIVGFAINLVALFLFNATGNYLPQTPLWVDHALQLSTVVLPITVAYAVIKHRVIDVSFVVSRTLVYGVLTTLLVGIFSLLDWFFTDYLRLARLGTVAEVGAVVGFGLWFNGLHRRVDVFVDATFFRQRHRAEVQLARTAAALPLATSTQIVAHALVAEPVRTLSLASAALFRRGPDGVLSRTASEGWAASDLACLDDSDGYFLTLLQAENGPLSLYDHPWRTEKVPSGPARPTVALPIMVRRELSAVVFYGAHEHGEPVDPDEVRAIAGLANGAAVAYDHIQAEAMQREVDAMRRENESLRSVIAEGQIQPA